MLLPCVVQTLQSDLAECNRPADEAAVQHQVNALASEGNAPESTAAANTGPSASDGADDHQAEAASQQQQQETGIPQQLDAQSPNQQADSMLDLPAVCEADSQPDNDTVTNAALAPAEVADIEEAELPGTENAAANMRTGVPAPKHHAPITNQSCRKPGRHRKSQKPTAGAPDVALQLDEAKSAGRAVTRCQLAKTGETLQSGMQNSAVLASVGLKPSNADSASDCQRPQLRRSRKGGKLEDMDKAGAVADTQPEVCHMSARTTADSGAAAAAKASTLGQNELGCSKCRYVKTGCKACRQRLSRCKEASGQGGRKRAPSASAAPRKAAQVQCSSHQAVHTGMQLHSQQPPAEGPEPNSRAARAANRAVQKPISRSGSGDESDAEQLAVKPMPISLQHRKLQSSLQHEAHACKQPAVKATPHKAVTVDLPADRPSTSAVAQTATLDTGACAQPTGLLLGTGEVPYSLRRSARHQQLAQPAVSGIAPEDVNKAAAQATTAAAAAVAAPTTAATPAAAEQVAPETVRRSGRARKSVLLQYDLMTQAQGNRSPPDDAKAQPPQSKAGRTESAASKGVKCSAAEHAVISDSEDDTPSASTASADAPAGKSTARRKKVCRQQAGLPVLSPIQEADEEKDQQPGPHPASEFVNHMVHTSSDIAQHLAGLSPAEKRKRRRKAPASIRDGSPAQSRLAVSADQSQQQTEVSNPMDVLLAAAEYSEAHAQQDSELKSARVKVSQPPISHRSASSSKSLIIVTGCALQVLAPSAVEQKNVSL